MNKYSNGVVDRNRVSRCSYLNLELFEYLLDCNEAINLSISSTIQTV